MHRIHIASSINMPHKFMYGATHATDEAKHQARSFIDLENRTQIVTVIRAQWVDELTKQTTEITLNETKLTPDGWELQLLVMGIT